MQMKTHKYSVGDIVALSAPPGTYVPAGLYEVVRKLPIESGQLTYRLRGKSELTERVASEEHMTKRSSGGGLFR